MRNPELFVKSVDILVDAYEKGNLEHLDPCHCAVGNMIAYTAGTYKFGTKTGGRATGSDWVVLMDLIREQLLMEQVTTEKAMEHPLFRPNEFGSSELNVEAAFEQAKMSGYTPNEMERIEAAFEKNEIRENKIGFKTRNSRRDEDPLDGLLKAVEVLGDIHEIPKETIHCMKEKIENKTYTKSFDLTPPTDGKGTSCTINLESLESVLQTLQYNPQFEMPGNPTV